MESKDCVLLIWETFSDTVTLYLFPEDHPDIEKIRKCHRKYVNSCSEQEDGTVKEDNDCEELMYVSDQLCDKNGKDLYEEFKLDMAYIATLKLQGDFTGETIMQIVLSGFIP